MEKSKSKSKKAVQIIGSILIAIALWLYVDNVQARKVTMNVNDVPVEFSGENSALADKGLMLLSGYDTKIDLKLRGARNVLYRLKGSKVRIVADTSSINATGTQTLSYRVVYPDNISSTAVAVDSASSYTVTVTVGELSTKDVEIRCDMVGELAKGYVADTLILDPAVLTLRGQRDDLINVSYAKITMNLNDSDKSIVNAYAFTLYDYNDIPISNDNIRPAVKLIQANLPVRTTKEVPLKLDFVEAVGSTLSHMTYTIQPEKVTLSGSKDALAQIDSIILGTVYLQDLGNSQTLTFTITAPEHTKLEGDTATAMVTVVVTGVSETTLTTNRISFENVPAGFTATPVTESLNIALRGLTTEIAAITGEQLKIVADLAGISAVAGNYTVPAYVYVEGFQNVGVKGTYQVIVNISGVTSPG